LWRRNANKYNARKTAGIDGRAYHSALEANLNNLLMARENAGEIKILKRQQRIYFSFSGIKICEYWPDFTIYDNALNSVFWLEAKGFPTREYEIKKSFGKSAAPVN